MQAKEIREYINELNDREKRIFLTHLKNWESSRADNSLLDQGKRIIDYLNSKRTNARGFGYTDANLRMILARVKEYGVDACIDVIEIKSKDPYFMQNPKYLNTQTLFRPGNFEKYINEIPKELLING